MNRKHVRAHVVSAALDAEPEMVGRIIPLLVVSLAAAVALLLAAATPGFAQVEGPVQQGDVVLHGVWFGGAANQDDDDDDEDDDDDDDEDDDGDDD